MAAYPKRLRHIESPARVEVKWIGAGESELLHASLESAQIAEMLADDFADCCGLLANEVFRVNAAQRKTAPLGGGRSVALVRQKALAPLRSRGPRSGAAGERLH